jgi:glutathione synthase/RimK-type ligase-like ATP-grasp enzyme
VTQKPWNRFPVESKTLVMNSILSCVAGGRNKLVASKAYEFLNLELGPYGLSIRTPDTVTDVSLAEIPLYVKSMGMCAVVKVPYSNAGQGVFTITSKEELDVISVLCFEKFLIICTELYG